MGKARKIGRDQRAAFAMICDDTRKGFSEVIDLILIHNEKDVRGPQPRTTLNPLIAMLSVAAWERLVADVGYLARSHDPSTVLPGQSDSRGFNRLGADSNGGPSTAISTLTAASGGQLPVRWRVHITGRSNGKLLKFGYTAEGLDPLLAELVDWWIDVRHKVAHRALPQLLDWLETTDAKDGQTINTTTARSAFTLFLQLADQTIRTISEVAEFEQPDELWLPPDWLTGTLPAPYRGVTDLDQLQLWRGRSLSV